MGERGRNCFLRFPAVSCGFLQFSAAPNTYLADQGPNLQKSAKIFDKLPFLPFSLSHLALPKCVPLQEASIFQPCGSTDYFGTAPPPKKRHNQEVNAQCGWVLATQHAFVRRLLGSVLNGTYPWDQLLGKVPQVLDFVGPQRSGQVPAKFTLQNPRNYH